MIRIATVFSIIHLFLSSQLSAQTSGPLLWEKTDSRSGITTPGGAPLQSYIDVKALSSGNVIAFGETGGIGASVGGDIVLRKHNKTTGAVEVERFIDGYNGGYGDVAVKLLLAEPFMYVIATSTYNLSPFDKDIIIYKMDTSFTTVWINVFNNTTNPDDVAADAGLDLLGNLYVLGTTSRAATGRDLVVRKLSSAGTVLYTKYYSSTGNFNDLATAMAVEPNGVCNITGSYTSATLGTRMLALKLWSNGVQLWVKYHDTVSGAVSADVGTSVTYDPVSGDMYICGRGNNSSGNDDWVVVKFAASDGAKVWFNRHAGTGTPTDFGAEVVYANGALYSCGTITTAVSGIVSRNIMLKKYNPVDGAVLWTKTYNIANAPGGPSDESAQTMIVSPSGSIYVGGSGVVNSGTFSTTYQIVLCYNSSGVLQWAHNDPNSGFSSGFQGIGLNALDFSVSQNAVYAVGYEWVGMGVFSSTTILKLGPTTIAPLMAQRVESALGMDETLSTMSVFPNPAIDYFYFSHDSQEGGQLELINLQGQVVYAKVVNETITRVDMASLPSGLYIVRFVSGNKILTQRLILQ